MIDRQRYLYVSFFVLLLGGILILGIAFDNLNIGVIFAFINLLIISFNFSYFVRQKSIQSIIPILFLAWITVGWIIGTIYFGLFETDAAYLDIHGIPVRFLYKSIYLQMAIFSFISSYLLIMRFMMPRGYPFVCSDIAPSSFKRITAAIVLVTFSALTLNSISKLIKMPDAIVYLADGSYLYLNGLLLIVGASFTSLTTKLKFQSGATMVLFGIFYTIGNARAMALIPISMFFVGLYFLSEISWKTKRNILFAFALALPSYLIVADTSRAVTGSIGFDDISSRIEAFSQSTQLIMSSKESIPTKVLGRFFFTGGHGIISMTPESIPYLQLDVTDYLWEIMTNIFVPGAFYYKPIYSGSSVLRIYGFNIKPGVTSVEISTVGSLWILGGAIPVIVGGLIMGVLHVCIGKYVHHLHNISPMRALFFFAMMAPTIFWGSNLDLIQNIKIITWHWVGAMILYKIIYKVVFSRRTFRSSDG